MSTSPIPDSEFVRNVCSNTKSDFIQITEDKLENILLKFLSKYKKTKQWLTPFSLFVATLTTLLTADFNKDAFTVPKEFWEALFYVMLVLCFIWFCISLILTVYNKKYVQLDLLIKRIKNS